MTKFVEDNVRRFYDEEGWVKNDAGVLKDSANWAPKLPAHRDHTQKIVKRIAAVFAEGGDLFLNCGCGPFSAGAMAYAANFERRICVDISTRALSLCREKLNQQGLYMCMSMNDLGLKDSTCDGTLCEHALYHVNRDLQERTVREMIRVTKPGRPIVIIYSNPLSPLNVLEDLYRCTGINKLFGGGKLYFFRFRLGWWKRFGDSCDIEIRPFDPISARQAGVLLPAAFLSRLFFSACSRLEDRVPGLARQLWNYPAIILRKRP